MMDVTETKISLQDSNEFNGLEFEPSGLVCLRCKLGNVKRIARSRRGQYINRLVKVSPQPKL
jgi:hypothetical protein